MIVFKHKGNFNNTDRFFKTVKNRQYLKVLTKYAQLGVDALSSATPFDTGNTASSWTYEIIYQNGSYKIYWNNTNINNGVNIALILQMGHGTGTGGYVKGIDYINPAMQGIFDGLAEDAWKEVTSL